MSTDVEIEKNEAHRKIDRLLDSAVVLLICCLLIFMFSRTISEYDLWGHLKFGIDYIAAGRLLDVDPYSYVTAGYRWIEHCWLFEVLIGAMYNAAGVMGLCVTKLALSSAILILLFSNLIRNRVPPLYAGMLMIVCSLLMAPALFPLRPHLCTYLLFTLVMLCLQNADAGNRRWLLALPVLFALWCNLHGGYLAGLAMVGLFVVINVITICWRNRSVMKIFSREVGELIAALIASMLACLLNPYGLELTLFLIRTLSTPRPEIPEWQPLMLFSFLGSMYLLTLVICFASLIQTKDRRSPAMIALFAAAAIQPLAAARHAPLFAIAALIVCAPHIASTIQNRFGVAASRLLPNANDGFRRGFGVLLLFSSISLLAAGVPNLTTIKINGDIPVQAVKIIETSGVKGNLATFFDWGEYCIWHLYPSMKVSTDGRREASYSPAAQALNLKFTYGLSDWDSVLTQYPTDVVLAAKSVATFSLMKMLPEYDLIFEDGVCGLFAKRGSDAAEKLSAAAKSEAEQVTGAPRLFP